MSSSVLLTTGGALNLAGGGGGGSGVSALNTLSGSVSLVSTDSSISVAVVGQTLDLTANVPAGGGITALIGSEAGSVQTTASVPTFTGVGSVKCASTADGVQISVAGGSGGGVYHTAVSAPTATRPTGADAGGDVERFAPLFVIPMGLTAGQLYQCSMTLDLSLTIAITGSSNQGLPLIATPFVSDSASGAPSASDFAIAIGGDGTPQTASLVKSATQGSGVNAFPSAQHTFTYLATDANIYVNLQWSGLTNTDNYGWTSGTASYQCSAIPLTAV
jgi:hypothetical protein